MKLARVPTSRRYRACPADLDCEFSEEIKRCVRHSSEPKQAGATESRPW
jgi:hypothetical protein